MVAFLLRPTKPRWLTLSFPSTLYLCPILDLLLQDIAEEFRTDVRLGLQEGLVNAAKHGNQLDPSKCVTVRYARLRDRHEWTILDQGVGFLPPTLCRTWVSHNPLPEEGCECGRGLFILFQVFDQVQWNATGTQLSLTKYVNR
ncbi:MAG: anti-sigma regulatory factor [Thermosynechococcaceae cyanobacterium]